MRPKAAKGRVQKLPFRVRARVRASPFGRASRFKEYVHREKRVKFLKGKNDSLCTLFEFSRPAAQKNHHHGFLSSSFFDDKKDPVRGDNRDDDHLFILFCALRTRKTSARESRPVRGAFYPRGRRLEIIIIFIRRRRRRRRRRRDE